MNDKPLRSVLSSSLNRKNLNFVDKFLKDNGCQRLHRHKLSYCSDKAARGVLCGVKAFELVLQVKHLLFEFFLLNLVFVRQSHKPIVRDLAVYVILIHSPIEPEQFLTSCSSRR